MHEAQGNVTVLELILLLVAVRECFISRQIPACARALENASRRLRVYNQPVDQAGS